jgi:hypothetical protein
MVSRYHWLTSSVDTGWTGLATTPWIQINVPAGATIKRFVVNLATITGKITGSSTNIMQPIYCNQTVDMPSGQYAGRILYQQAVRVPCDNLSTMVSEVGIGLRQYDQIICAGDRELGINEKTSYGKLGGSAMVMRYIHQIVPTGPNPGLATGRTTYQFKVLYYL